MSDIEVTPGIDNGMTSAEHIAHFQEGHKLKIGLSYLVGNMEQAEKMAQDLSQMLEDVEATVAEMWDTLTLNLQVKGFHSIKMQPLDENMQATGMELIGDPETFTFTRHVELRGVFWAIDDQFHFIIPNTDFRFQLGAPSGQSHTELDERREVLQELNARNLRMELTPPPNLKLHEDVRDIQTEEPPSVCVTEWSMLTTPEYDALEKAASDGKSGMHYTDNLQSFTRRHQRQGAAHYVQLHMTEQERQEGIGIEALTALTSDQDADCVLALLYVTRALTQNLPASFPPTGYAGGWIDIDDVIKKIGWTARNTAHREELRQKAYRYLQFGARAVVIGSRTHIYKDTTTHEVIPTRIDAPLWAFMAKQQRFDIPLSLFPSFEVPLRQEIVLSREWLHLLTQADIAHMLPMGELLGAIPPDQPSGAWARVIGLALANLWRREPRLILAGFSVPRRELLTRYTPKLQPVNEILHSQNAGRALEYWHLALGLLVEKGFLAREDEAAAEYVPQKKGRKSPGWQEKWLDTPVLLRPSKPMSEVLSAIAKNKFDPKPRDFSKQKKQRTRKVTSV